MIEEPGFLAEMGSFTLAEGKQVDALAFYPGPSSNYVAVAVSSLTGNTWDGYIAIIDPSQPFTDDRACVISHAAVPCGVADLCWAGRGSAIVTAEDNGDAKVTM